MGIEDCQEIEDVYDLLQESEQEIRQISGPEESDASEREIMGYTNFSAALLLQKKL